MRWRSFLLFLAAIAAGVSLGVGLRVLRLEKIQVTLRSIVPAPDFRAGRAIYPYSLIPGGVRNSYELSESIAHDPVIAAYYRDLRPAAMFPLRLASDTVGYVSYRVGNQIFWTHHIVHIRKGELVLTDGTTMIRGRCGNQIVPAYLRPAPATTTLDPGPPDMVFETGYPPVMTGPHNEALLAEKHAPALPALPASPNTESPPTFWPPLIPPLMWCCSGDIHTGPPAPVPPVSGGVIPPAVVPPGAGDTPPAAPPVTPIVPATPVPEPATFLLVGSGLMIARFVVKRSGR